MNQKKTANKEEDYAAGTIQWNSAPQVAFFMRYLFQFLYFYVAFPLLQEHGIHTRKVLQ